MLFSAAPRFSKSVAWLLAFAGMTVITMHATHSSTLAADRPLVFISAFATGEKAGIHAFEFDVQAGALKPVHRTADVQNPFFLALSPNRKYLYSIHAKAFGGKEHEEVAAFELEGRTGKLKLLNRQSALGSAACYLDVDATGKMLVVANYTTGNVASLPIKSDGSLGEAAAMIQHVGSSVDASRQKEPHAHCFVVGPDNKFAFAADLGLDQVLSYRLDPATGKIAPHTQAFVRTPPGAGPRHLTFRPNGKQMYVINELKNSVTLFDYDTANGYLLERQTISTLPADFTGRTYCADLKITPNGKFLYGTNRGHDSIACYGLADDGQMSLIAIEPSLGKGPQNLAVLPGGDYLLCANMPGSNVIVFRIDQATGKISPVGDPVSLPSPSCIMLVP